MVPEWEGLVVLALMEDQYQGVQGMETSSEDNMVHLGKIFTSLHNT